MRRLPRPDADQTESDRYGSFGRSNTRLVRRERQKLFEEIIADYMEHSRRTKRSHNNDRIKAERFLALFRGRMAADVTTKEIEDFRAGMMAERKVATVNHHLKFLKAVYNRTIRQGRLASNPVTPMRLQRENNARNRCLARAVCVRIARGEVPPQPRPLLAAGRHSREHS